MSRLELKVTDHKGTRPLHFDVKRMVNAGYVGRDPHVVRRHLEELAREGVPPPDSVPTFYPMLRSGLTCSECIEVVDAHTSGEAEYVLLVNGPNVYIGLGSDHTDRRLEADDVLKSKQACSNVIAREVWDYTEVQAHWDRLEMSSWVRNDAESDWIPYQRGSLAAILPADRLLELVNERMADECRDGLVIFSGTLPLLEGTFIYGTEFRCELVDPVLRRAIRCCYAIERLAYLKPLAVTAGRNGMT